MDTPVVTRSVIRVPTNAVPSMRSQILSLQRRGYQPCFALARISAILVTLGLMKDGTPHFPHTQPRRKRCQPIGMRIVV